MRFIFNIVIIFYIRRRVFKVFFGIKIYVKYGVSGKESLEIFKKFRDGVKKEFFFINV